MHLFQNRQQAGQRLAQALLRRGYDETFLVLGLGKGGVVVAYEVAATLQARLDIVAADGGPVEARYRKQRQASRVDSEKILLVTEGMATGEKIRKAIDHLRKLGAASVHVAVPVGSRAACKSIERLADRLVLLAAPAEFSSVEEWFGDFQDATDADVTNLLSRGRRSSTAS